MSFAPLTKLTRLVLLATTFGLPAGCGESDVRPPPVGSLEVSLGGAPGVDGSGYVPLSGDAVLVPGAQGGFHVWMKYRVSGASPGVFDVSYTVRRTRDARLILTAKRRQEIGAPSAEGYWELPVAIPAFMCPSPIGVDVRDEPMRFVLEILAPAPDATLLGSATADVTPHCPDGDHASFCDEICRG